MVFGTRSGRINQRSSSYPALVKENITEPQILNNSEGDVNQNSLDVDISSQTFKTLSPTAEEADESEPIGESTATYPEKSSSLETLGAPSSIDFTEEDKSEEPSVSEEELDVGRELRMNKKCDSMVKRTPKKNSVTTVNSGKCQNKRKRSDVSESKSSKKKKKAIEGGVNKQTKSKKKKVTFDAPKSSNNKIVSARGSKVRTCFGRPPMVAAKSQPQRFLFAKAKKRYAFMTRKKKIAERVMVFDASDEHNLKVVISKVGLISSVTGLSGFVDKVIWEFYAHLPDKKTHESEIKLFVRGHKYLVGG